MPEPLPGLDYKEFRGVQHKIISVLSDGCRYTTKQLKERCLGPDTESNSAISVRMTILKLKLRPMGYAIISELIDRKAYYRLVSVIDNTVQTDLSPPIQNINTK